MQFFPMENLRETLDQFDLAPCRVAISGDAAFCTDDALYAFATGVCKNSCGSEERLEKYKERGFDTDDLPESLEGRQAWDMPDYARACEFLHRLLEPVNADE
jgi:hypothetical protein